MENENKIFKTSPVMAIVLYLLLFIVGASFITLAITNMYSKSTNIPYEDLIGAITENDLTLIPQNLLAHSAIIQGVSNFLAYFITLLFVILYLKEELVKDFFKIKENIGKFLLYTLCLTILFLGISFFIENICSRYAPPSNNQSIIEYILEYGGAVPMIIATVFLAPILEELIYRKAIFMIFKKSNIYLTYIISILAFTLPHVFSTPMDDFLSWILITIPYLTSAFLLALFYHKTNENIYTTILIHMANNLIAVILIII